MSQCSGGGPAPSARPPHVTKQEGEALPATITLRYVRYGIDIAGFRTRHIMVATTLLEAPAKELAQLYLRRWDIELCCDDIKTTMAMDFIRAKSPAMAVKMLTLYAIAYNLVRLLMQQAVRTTGSPTARGELDAPVLQGRAGCYLALRRRNGTGSPQAMAQPARKTVPNHRHRLLTQARPTLRTQSR